MIIEQSLQANFALFYQLRVKNFGKDSEALENIQELLWVQAPGLDKGQLESVDNSLTSENFTYRALLEFFEFPESSAFDETMESVRNEVSLAPIFELESGDTDNEDPVIEVWAAIGFSQLASMTSGYDSSSIGISKSGRLVVEENRDEVAPIFYYSDSVNKVDEVADWIRYNWLADDFLADDASIANVFACEIVIPSPNGEYPNLVAVEEVPLTINGPVSEFSYPEDHCEDFPDTDSEWTLGLDPDQTFRDALLTKLKENYNVPVFQKFYVLTPESQEELDEFHAGTVHKQTYESEAFTLANE